jgi:hypothetical protein
MISIWLRHVRPVSPPVFGDAGMSAPAAFLGPARDLVLVGSGFDHQVGGVARAGFPGGSFVEAEQDPGGVGEEVGTPGGGRGDAGQRLAFLLARAAPGRSSWGGAAIPAALSGRRGQPSGGQWPRIHLASWAGVAWMTVRLAME